MPTIKQRINLSVSGPVHRAVLTLAKRDRLPLATKVHNLLLQALELEEDLVFEKIAEERGNQKVKRVSHAQAWK